MTKKELEAKLKLLEQQLEKEQARPTGHTIANCNIHLEPDEVKLAIARAVNEGMKALQSCGGDTCAIKFEGVKNED